MVSGENPRFGSLNLEQIKQKQADLVNVNSLKNEKKAVEAFKAYLQQIGIENTDFFTYTEQELDEHLWLSGGMHAQRKGINTEQVAWKQFVMN